MDAGYVLVAGLIAGLIGMNIAATLKVHASSFYEKKQKSIQYVLIWLVPVLGAILCYGLARQNDGPHSGKYPEYTSLYEDGSVGVENANVDYFGGGHHSD
jgi:hypothetical protein